MELGKGINELDETLSSIRVVAIAIDIPSRVMWIISRISPTACS